MRRRCNAEAKKGACAQWQTKTGLVVEVSDDAIDVSFSAANANATRAFTYEVRVTGEGEPLMREVVAEGFDQAPDGEWANRPSHIVFEKADLPRGEGLEIAVTPVSSLGVRGKPLTIQSERDFKAPKLQVSG